MKLKVDIFTRWLMDSNGQVYDRAVKAGLDLSDFINKTVFSELGDTVYAVDRVEGWQTAAYMLEWFCDEFEFLPSQRFYNLDPWAVGYFYRYWQLTRGISIREVVTYAPLNRIDQLYMDRLHFCGWEYWIEELTDIYTGKLKMKDPEWS